MFQPTFHMLNPYLPVSLIATVIVPYATADLSIPSEKIQFSPTFLTEAETTFCKTCSVVPTAVCKSTHGKNSKQSDKRFHEFTNSRVTGIQT